MPDPTNPPADTQPALPAVPTPVVDPTNPNPPPQVDPMNDPNLKMQRIVSRRNTEDKKPEDKPKEAEKKEPGDIKKLGSEIGKQLGFRADKPKEPDKKEEKTDDQKSQEDKTTEAGKGSDKEPAKDAGDPKTIVKAKKAAPPATDPVKIATAAATAAVKALTPEHKQTTPATVAPETLLKSDDLHEYEVAKYLSESDPRFKDAPKIVLDQVKKAEAYASNWEKENKGKIFDPNDEEHDSFYAALEKPWADHEFRKAEMEMAAERVAERKSKGSEQKIQELEQENARNALAPIIDRTYTTAAAVLAKKMGEDVHDKIVKNTFDKFADEDPVTANAMATAIGPLQPIIEAAIQLDDPKMRFKFDPKNQAHLEWNRLLLEKESQLEGTDDGNGRTMVSRADYVAMQPSQRARHWFLDVSRFIDELVNDAADSAKKMIEEENKRLEKFAATRGYVLQKQSQASNNKPDKKSDDPPKDPVKPASPASAGSAKIDDKTEENPSVAKKLLQTTAGILFSR